MRTMGTLVSALVVTLTLVACADPGRTPSDSEGATVTGPPGQPTPTTPGDLPVPSGTGAPGKTPGKSPERSAARMTLTGTIVAGVEPNCLLLDNYLLVGGPPEVLKSGKRVTVTGRVQADVMTTCQQGTPFMVESAKPA